MGTDYLEDLHEDFDMPYYPEWGIDWEEIDKRLEDEDYDDGSFEETT